MSAVHAAIAQYGQDQNELSAPEVIGTGTNLAGDSYANAYECLYDGYINITRPSGFGFIITLWTNPNDTIDLSHSFNGYISARIFVEHGNRIYVGGNQSSGEIKAQWFKKRDYSGRS